MVTLQTVLELPQHIHAGLSLGTYERIGGVIRETNSKQIVAWLRDGNQLAQTESNVFGSFAQTVSTFTSTGLLINLALSSVSFGMTLRRLNKLSELTHTILEDQRAARVNERDSELQSAVLAARDALEATRSATKEQRAYYAIQTLYQCQQKLKNDLLRSLEENPALAQHYFTRALYAAITRIRCYLEIDEFDLARDRLTEEIDVFNGLARSMITRWIGKHPALFLHRDVSSENCYRFINICEWLEAKPFSEILVENIRSDFWNAEVIKEQPDDLFTRLRGEKPVRLSDTLSLLPYALSNAEAMIENIQRLRGYELELRSARLMGSNFSQWSDLVDANEALAVLTTDVPLELVQ